MTACTAHRSGTLHNSVITADIPNNDHDNAFICSLKITYSKLVFLEGVIVQLDVKMLILPGTQ